MISFFGARASLYVKLSLGFGGICNGMCTSSIIEVFHYFYYFHVYVVMGCFVRTSFSSCCESFVDVVDYCVCGVRLLSSLVCGFSSGSRLAWGFLTN